MGRGIDAQRHAAHDAQARVRKRGGEGVRIALALRARVAAADDRKCRRVEQLRAPHRMDHGGRIGNREQRLWITRIAERDQVVVACLEPSQRALHQRRRRAAHQGLHRRGLRHRCKLRYGRLEHGLRPAEGVQQLPLDARRDAGDEREAQPGKDVLDEGFLGQGEGTACGNGRMPDKRARVTPR
jgi:hypothetical protein